MRKVLRIERMNLMPLIREAELAKDTTEFNRLVALYNELTTKLEAI